MPLAADIGVWANYKGLVPDVYFSVVKALTVWIMTKVRGKKATCVDTERSHLGTDTFIRGTTRELGVNLRVETTDVREEFVGNLGESCRPLFIFGGKCQDTARVSHDRVGYSENLLH